MSSHPDPGNRSAYIEKEAAALTVTKPADVSGFPTAKGLFAGLPAPKPMADLARRSEPADSTAAKTGTPGQPVPPPSAEMKTLSAGIFQASVPGNWVSLQSSRAIRVAPQNGYGQLNGRDVFTHGVEFGVAAASSRDLREATSTWLRAIAQGNPNLKVAGQAQYVKMSGRTALAVQLSNPSELGGAERIVVYTTFLADGSLFYFLTLVPEADAQTYQQTFSKIGQSIRLTDVR